LRRALAIPARRLNAASTRSWSLSPAVAGAALVISHVAMTVSFLAGDAATRPLSGPASHPIPAGNEVIMRLGD
jgi:hypothetical protein